MPPIVSDETTGQFTIISKKDGSVVREIRMPIKEKRTPYVFFPEGVYTVSEINFSYGKDYLIINEAACDTIYKLYPKTGELQPFIIKTPKMETLDKNKTSYLYLAWESNAYITFSKITVDKSNINSPINIYDYYFYDKKEKRIYEEITKHVDRKVYRNFFGMCNTYSYYYFAESIQAYFLTRNSGKDRVYGKLREIVETLDENDNPVITILTLKEENL